MSEQPTRGRFMTENEGATTENDAINLSDAAEEWYARRRDAWRTEQRDDGEGPGEWRGLLEAAAEWHPDWAQGPGGYNWTVSPRSLVADAGALLKAYDQHLLCMADRLTGTKGLV